MGVKMKRFLSAFLLVMIIPLLPFNSFTAASGQEAKGGAVAAITGPKEEVIYAMLDSEGSANEIYAVNILNVSEAGLIYDYGTYSLIKNLTSVTDMVYEGDQVSAEAPVGRFYYQGNLISKDLPWNISVSYSMDSKEISADELAGKSGHLTIRINTDKNPEVNPVFFDNYLLQIMVPLDTGICSNIIFTDGTAANSGTDRLITFTAMPKKAGEFTVSADVVDFTMGSMQFSAIPFNMGIELPDTSAFTDNLSLLTDAVAQLDKGIGSLSDAFAGLEDGIAELDTGSSEFREGIARLSGGSGKLVDASGTISKALSDISAQLKQSGLSAQGEAGSGGMEALLSLPSALSQISSGLSEISMGFASLQDAYASAYGALSDAAKAIPDTEIPEKSLQELAAANPGNPALSMLMENYTAARTIKAVYQNVSPAFDVCLENHAYLTKSLAAASEALKTINGQLQSALESSDIAKSLPALIEGFSLLSENYKSFHEGLAEYTGGVADLANAYKGLDKGVSDIREGMEAFGLGLGGIGSGSHELSGQAANIPGEIDKAMDGILDEYDTTDFTPVSFLSPENESVMSVQFVMRTEKIALPEAPKEAPAAEKADNFWTRLVKLFTFK